MTDNEPSMDEILNSIHNILAEGEAEASDADVAQDQMRKAQASAQPEKPALAASAPVEDVRPRFSVKDDAPAVEDAPQTSAAPSEPADQSADVLDLTQDMIVSRPQDVMTPRQESAGLHEEADFTSHISEREYPMSQEENAQTVDDDLISANTAASAVASLSQLTQAFSSQKKQAPASQNGGVTLDALVSELIKPYLKAWLDQNLPAIVDEAVQKEIARLVERSIR